MTYRAHTGLGRKSHKRKSADEDDVPDVDARGGKEEKDEDQSKRKGKMSDEEMRDKAQAVISGLDKYKWLSHPVNLPTERVVAPDADIRARETDKQHVTNIKSQIRQYGVLQHRINVFVVCRNDALYNKMISITPENRKKIKGKALEEFLGAEKLEAFAGDHTRSAFHQLVREYPDEEAYKHIPVKLFITPRRTEVNDQLQEFGVLDNLISQTVNLVLQLTCFRF